MKKCVLQWNGRSSNPKGLGGKQRQLNDPNRLDKRGNGGGYIYDSEEVYK